MTADQPKFLIADLFCGAGGSSTGAERAIAEMGGKMELVAVNHWPIAVETHQRNHPSARHYVQNIDTVDPENIVTEGKLDLLMASPECRFYSRARGGKPIHDQGRMNPWAIQRWLTAINVRCVLVENVPEFTSWGPLDENGKPIKKRAGEYFNAWARALIALGYEIDYRILNAADYGEATCRKRFFMQARNDGIPIVWPEPTHSHDGKVGLFGALPKWHGAKEIINWSNNGKSLLDDPKYQKNQLALNTRRRIARGLQKFGGPLAPLYIRLLDLPPEEEAQYGCNLEPGKPFIIKHNGENGSARVHCTDDPLPTITCRGTGCLVDANAEPFLNANRTDNAPKSIDEPVPCITTAHGGGSVLVEPDLRPFMLGQQSGGAPRDTAEPVPTIATAGKISLVHPTIIQYYGQSFAQDTNHPLTSITGCRKHAVVNPVIVEYYGNSEAASVDNPLPTVTTKARHGLANPAVIELAHGNGSQGEKDDDRQFHSVDEPLGSITMSPGLGLAQPVVVQTSRTGGDSDYAKSPESPLLPKADLTLAVPLAHDVADPLPAVNNRGASNLITRTIAEAVAQEASEAGIDPKRIVFLDGNPCLLDIRFRMLQNSELARAMGFDNEETKYEFVGNISEVTKQIGNAVPVRLATALVRSILQDHNRAPQQAPTPAGPLQPTTA